MGGGGIPYTFPSKILQFRKNRALLPQLSCQKRQSNLATLPPSQGKSPSRVPGDFEAVLPSGRDTVLLLGGAVCGGELRSTLRAGERRRRND